MRQPPPDEQYEWSDPPEGYEIRWVASENWRLATPEEALERKCRRPGCQHKPIAALNRGRSFGGQKVDSWWLYCGCHLYGRRINVVDGIVEGRRAVKIESK